MNTDRLIYIGENTQLINLKYKSEDFLQWDGDNYTIKKVALENNNKASIINLCQM